MNVSTRNIGAILAIDISGKLDTQTSVAASEEVMKQLESNPAQVLFSLAMLDFVTSAGLLVILRAAKHVRAYGGNLKVSGAQGVVKEVLEISGFDSLLDLYEDEEQAVSFFQ